MILLSLGHSALPPVGKYHGIYVASTLVAVALCRAICTMGGIKELKGSAQSHLDSLMLIYSCIPFKNVQSSINSCHVTCS